jgi:hypothetical protein
VVATTAAGSGTHDGCISDTLRLDLRPSKNTKSPLVYRQGALLSNTRYIGSDGVILTYHAILSIEEYGSGTSCRYTKVVSRF